MKQIIKDVFEALLELLIIIIKFAIAIVMLYPLMLWYFIIKIAKDISRRN